MRPRALRLLLLLSAAVLVHCASGGRDAGPADDAATPVVLWFDDYNEVLEGFARASGRYLQGGELDLRSRTDHVRCVGSYHPRILPPEANPPLRCDGIEGDARLTCSNGRRIALEWSSNAQCGGGYGQGADADGHSLHMAWGGSRSRAEVMLTEALAAQSGKPRLPAPRDLVAEAGGTPSVSTGTAFFVRFDGYLVTNHHVVSHAARIQVKLHDGQVLEAEVVSKDAENDLAILRVEAIGQPLPLRRKHELVRGEEVFTLGYPLVQLQGQEQKATFGRVNSLTGLRGDARYTQVDVPIQPGNSGGPLIDGDGAVVGVITSMLHPMLTLKTAGVVPQNVNYALKSDFAHQALSWKLGQDWDEHVELGSGGNLTEMVDRLSPSVVLVVAD
ncbi:MAG: S1C family serine protease [Myxococcota bacterium]|nr:S1C family serine protease [Myxococcota bacterium]